MLKNFMDRNCLYTWIQLSSNNLLVDFQYIGLHIVFGCMSPRFEPLALERNDEFVACVFTPHEET